MIVDIKKYLDFLEKNKLTQSQFLFLHCLYFKQYSEIKQYKRMFPTENDTMIGTGLLNDLVNNGYIEKVDEKGTAASYKLTKKFTKIFVDKHIAARDIFNAYPPFSISDGKTYPLTLMDENELADIYILKIAHVLEEHEAIIKDINYAKAHNLIKGKLETFVKSRHWLAIRPLREEFEKTTTPVGKGFNSDFT